MGILSINGDVDKGNKNVLDRPFGIDLTGDNKVEKRILRAGINPNHKPQNMSYVTINFVCYMLYILYILLC